MQEMKNILTGGEDIIMTQFIDHDKLKLLISRFEKQINDYSKICIMNSSSKDCAKIFCYFLYIYLTRYNITRLFNPDGTSGHCS